MARIDPQTSCLKNGTLVTLRNPSKDDASALLHAATSVMAEHDFLLLLPSEFNLTVEQEVEWIQTRNASAHEIFIVAEVTGDIIGGIGFTQDGKYRHQHHGMIGMFVTLPYRHQGVGSLLLQRVLNWASTHPGLEKICLEVFGHNQSAIHLYEKFGFVEEGRRLKNGKLDSNRYTDEILMARFL